MARQGEREPPLRVSVDRCVISVLSRVSSNGVIAKTQRHVGRDIYLHRQPVVLAEWMSHERARVTLSSSEANERTTERERNLWHVEGTTVLFYRTTEKSQSYLTRLITRPYAGDESKTDDHAHAVFPCSRLKNVEIAYGYTGSSGLPLGNSICNSCSACSDQHCSAQMDSICQWR